MAAIASRVHCQGPLKPDEGLLLFGPEPQQQDANGRPVHAAPAHEKAKTRLDD